MRLHTVVPAALLLATSAVPTAQRGPNFSGERQLNLQASALSPPMRGAESGRLTIEHREPNVRVHLTLVVDGKPFETVVERVTDGREVSTVRGGRETVSSAKWDGEALLFTSRSQGAGCEGTLSIRYELQDGARRVRAVEKIRGCGRDQDNVWVFDRA